MIDKSTFTPEEWSQILASPMLAGLAVTLADPSGLFGTMKEGTSSARALLEARNGEPAGSLAKVIADEFSTSAGRASAREAIKLDMTAGKPAELKVQALSALANVNSILKAKAGDDAPAFRSWLKSIAQDAAEAAREGGFLGFGGEKVSEAEKATLAEIEQALA